MNSGIYRIRNTLDDKCYVGSTADFKRRSKEHFRELKRDTHCNIKLQRAYNKYGRPVFVFELLEEAPYNLDIVQLEDSWISKLDSKKAGYNIADASFGDMLTNHPDREGIIARIAATTNRNIAAMTEEERKTKWGHYGVDNAMFGTKRPLHVLEAMQKGQRDFIEKNGHGPNKGYKQSDEHKRKLGIRASARTGDKNSFFGKKHSPETIEVMKKKAIGRPCATRRPLFVDGIRYEHTKDAAAATGIKAGTIGYRCGSPNLKFKRYYFEDQLKAV